jgi:hypothetical protein
MSKVTQIAALLAALGAAVAGAGGFVACWHVARAADAVAATATAMPGQIDRLQTALVGQIAQTRADLDDQVLFIRQDVVRFGYATIQEVRDSREVADRRIGDSLARVDTLVQHATPVLDDTASLIAMANQDLADARPAVEAAINPTEVAGVVRDTRFAAARAARMIGHIETASDDFDAAMPKVLANVQAATDASANASANANTIMSNLAAATKPLPRGVRVGLQIGGPVAQITSYVILMLATLGVL